MAWRFAVLLGAIVVKLDCHRSDLPALTAAQRECLLVEWNRTERTYPKKAGLAELLSAVARRRGEASAVQYGREQLTYSELNRRANQLARHLRKRGVGPEQLVALYTEQSVQMIVGLVGIVKSGGAYLPLDLAYPAQRIRDLLGDGEVKVCLTQQKLLRAVAGIEGVEWILLDEQWEEIGRESSDELDSGTGGESLAYVMYTSGSTGHPKGVSVVQRAVSRLVLNTDYITLTENDVVAQASNVAFDAATFEIWGALLNGTKLVGISKEVVLSPRELAAELAAQGITTLFLTTALFNQMAREVPGAFAGLSHLLFGGEAVDPRCVRAVLQAEGPARLLHMYGPTETTTYATWYEVKEVSDDAVTVPIGRPIANTEAYVLDHQRNPVPISVAGELHIGGDGLARGYWKRPELTAERFVAHPFRPGARLYNTGDLVRYRADGNLEFLGREDAQVKLRGFRVELGEIEAVLRDREGVKDCVVTVREEQPGQKRLVSYVVPQPQAELSSAALRRHLKEKLPDYMVPAAFVLLEQLPLTPNGKVDRQALPSPSAERSQEGQYVPPRSPEEEMLAGIWSELLGVERVGAHDDFFGLGGHSLAATQAISRVREAFQIEIPFPHFFEHPTIAELGQFIETRSRRGADQMGSIHRVSREGYLPLSFSQERVWFLLQLHPANKAYNAQAILRFKGALNTAALERSLNQIVQRHEIFRTTFPAVEGRPIQVIHPPQPVALKVVDLTSLSEALREREAQRLLDEEIQEPFDVTRLPLVRWTLWRVHPEEHLLAHVEHHFVHDGWSFNVFIRELKERYEAFASGKPAPLSEEPVQFADFAIWQRQWMEGEQGRAQLEYWKRKLVGSPPLLELPTDYPRPVVQSFRGAVLRRDLPLELCDALRAFSRREGASLFMTMFSGFLVLLQRYTSQDDLCVGSGLANRRLRETEGIIGMIVNTVVLRTELSGNPTVRELLRRVRQVTLEAYAHQDLPFDKVVEALQPDRSLSYSPIYQVLFSFHDSPLTELQWNDLTIEVTEGLSNGSAKSDLNIILIPRSEQQLGQIGGGSDRRITMLWEYNADLFGTATAERMVEHYLNLLRGLVAEPERMLSELPLLNEDETHQLLVKWNQAITPYPKDQNLAQLFEAQVERAPDAIAAVYGTERLSYGQLDKRANQLARYLKKRGVSPEQLVGLYAERSAPMVVGLLGIVKAGAAYLPVDLAYPMARVRAVLADGGVKVGLTQKSLLRAVAGLEGVEWICLDIDWEQISQESEQALESQSGGESLGYVIYTSGSTGEPKGVCVEQRAISRLVLNTDYVQLGENDVIAQASNVAFDAGTFEIWGALLNGAKLVGISKEVALSPMQFSNELKEQGITTLFLTTALFNQVAQEAPEGFAGLKHLLFGGEAVDVKWVREVLAKGRPQRLLHVYGPTETTTFATWYEVKELSDEATTVPIGRPIANTQLYVLDRWLKPVPVGVLGELHIGGDGLARGYWQREQLTVERFVENPFQSGERLYKTGDLVRYRVDGNVEFVGRNDEQVKVRGFRVELGEIESVLRAHEQVKECVVVVREEEPGNKQLVGYVVTEPGAEPSLGELRKHLAAKLPDYMVPVAFAFLEKLPLTPNGKVDRRALPRPNGELSGDGEYVAPRTEAEKLVASTWQEVLRLPRVGVRENFFAIGGHSLLATQVVSRLRRVFGVELPLRRLFDGPTVAQVAGQLEIMLRAQQNYSAAAETSSANREVGEL